MTEPASSDESAFFELVACPEPSVIFVTLRGLPPFNTALPGCMQAGVGADVAFGALELLDLVTRRSPALAFLAQSLSHAATQCPAIPRHRGPLGVLPGYYLFRETRLLAYASGLPGRADASGIFRGAALGLVWYGFTRNEQFIGRAALIAAQQAAAQRMSAHFASAVQSSEAEAGPAAGSRRAAASGDLHWACDLLGVTPRSSEREIDTAWRRLRALHHPDRAGRDPVEFERRSRVSKDLNRARDILLGSLREREARASA
jgi:hypothetical protein